MKRILSLILAVAALYACGPKDPGYVIKGQAGDLDGKAVLTYETPEGEAVNDTVAMNKGRFVFKGIVSDVVSGGLSLLPVGSDPLHYSMYIENCPITLDINPEIVIDYAQYGGKLLSDVKVTGGPNNVFAQALVEAQKAPSKMPEFKELATAMEEVRSMGYADMAAYQQKQMEVQNRFADQIPAYYEAIQEAINECIAGAPDVEAAVSMFNSYGSSLPLEEYEAGFNKFSEKARGSFLAKDAREELAARKATAPGAVAPDFTLNDPDSNPVTLSSLRGQYVIVDFWASWCKPCRAGVPAMKELYKKYHPKGLEIIGVSDDSNLDAWKTAIAQDQTPWIHVCDEFPEENKPARVGSLWGVHYIPSYFLLDKEGKVIGKMDHDELAAKLAELLD